MRWNARLAHPLVLSLILSMSIPTIAGTDPEDFIPEPVTMSFTKGDTRNGSKVTLRILGDSLYYSEVTYYPNAAPLESRKSIILNGHRRKALNGVMGELPRYPSFGSCYGRDMRFYMVETAQGKFYRSVPERSGKCYLDEPGIWSLFQDLDDLLVPPTDLDYQEYSAS
jgi:hypothetical protein